ncbi:MAG: OadG family protein [Candidatus Gastranaerophilales bacterium]|nr:OadG family protein [Candidatus Gastranaerophilales bacterium]
MLNPEVWVTGGTTMAVGMGIVFSFLVVMVFAMLIMSNVVAWLNKVCPVVVAEVKQAKKAATNDDSTIALVIAAAMNALKK